VRQKGLQRRKLGGRGRPNHEWPNGKASSGYNKEDSQLEKRKGTSRLKHDKHWEKALSASPKKRDRERQKEKGKAIKRDLIEDVKIKVSRKILSQIAVHISKKKYEKDETERGNVELRQMTSLESRCPRREDEKN